MFVVVNPVAADPTYSYQIFDVDDAKDMMSYGYDDTFILDSKVHYLAISANFDKLVVSSFVESTGADAGTQLISLNGTCEARTFRKEGWDATHVMITVVGVDAPTLSTGTATIYFDSFLFDGTAVTYLYSKSFASITIEGTGVANTLSNAHIFMDLALQDSIATVWSGTVCAWAHIMIRTNYDSATYFYYGVFTIDAASNDYADLWTPSTTFYGFPNAGWGSTDTKVLCFGESYRGYYNQPMDIYTDTWKSGITWVEPEDDQAIWTVCEYWSSAPLAEFTLFTAYPKEDDGDAYYMRSYLHDGTQTVSTQTLTGVSSVCFVDWYSSDLTDTLAVWNSTDNLYYQYNIELTEAYAVESYSGSELGTIGTDIIGANVFAIRWFGYYNVQIWDDTYVIASTTAQSGGKYLDIIAKKYVLLTPDYYPSWTGNNTLESVAAGEALVIRGAVTDTYESMYIDNAAITIANVTTAVYIGFYVADQTGTPSASNLLIYKGKVDMAANASGTQQIDTPQVSVKYGQWIAWVIVAQNASVAFNITFGYSSGSDDCRGLYNRSDTSLPPSFYTYATKNATVDILARCWVYPVGDSVVVDFDDWTYTVPDPSITETDPEASLPTANVSLFFGSINTLAASMGMESSPFQILIWMIITFGIFLLINIYAPGAGGFPMFAMIGLGSSTMMLLGGVFPMTAYVIVVAVIGLLFAGMMRQRF